MVMRSMEDSKEKERGRGCHLVRRMPVQLSEVASRFWRLQRHWPLRSAPVGAARKGRFESQSVYGTERCGTERSVRCEEPYRRDQACVLHRGLFRFMPTGRSDLDLDLLIRRRRRPTLPQKPLERPCMSSRPAARSRRGRVVLVSPEEPTRPVENLFGRDVNATRNFAAVVTMSS